MKLILAHIAATRKAPKSAPAGALARDYLDRAARLNPTEAAIFPSEAALLAAAERNPGRPAAPLILFDSTGELLTSEAFAHTLGRLRDSSVPTIFLAIGPASGWTSAALARATHTVSFGRVTLPHELARAVAAEQIYRALTILAGHPYHLGH